MKKNEKTENYWNMCLVHACTLSALQSWRQMQYACELHWLSNAIDSSKREETQEPKLQQDWPDHPVLKQHPNRTQQDWWVLWFMKVQQLLRTVGQHVKCQSRITSVIHSNWELAVTNEFVTKHAVFGQKTKLTKFHWHQLHFWLPYFSFTLTFLCLFVRHSALC